MQRFSELLQQKYLFAPLNAVIRMIIMAYVGGIILLFCKLTMIALTAVDAYALGDEMFRNSRA
jgi:hypothetical protein